MGRIITSIQIHKIKKEKKTQKIYQNGKQLMNLIIMVKFQHIYKKYILQ